MNEIRSYFALFCLLGFLFSGCSTSTIPEVQASVDEEYVFRLDVDSFRRNPLIISKYIKVVFEDLLWDSKRGTEWVEILGGVSRYNVSWVEFSEKPQITFIFPWGRINVVISDDYRLRGFNPGFSSRFAKNDLRRINGLNLGATIHGFSYYIRHVKEFSGPR